MLRVVAFFRVLVDLALPPRCPGCGAVTPADHLFCLPCWRALDFLGGPGCSTCGLPFDYDLGPDARCAGCIADPPALDAMRAAVAYGDIARRLALRLKHGVRPGLATTLARQMRRLLADRPVDLVVPVPLHRGRLWRRGYNQAALIARALALEAGLDWNPELLVRRRRTPLLRGLGRRDRARAVAGAFAVPPRWVAQLRGRHVLLVDDVYTTGATANACARVLKRAGAASVTACCWARVVREIDNGLAPPQLEQRERDG
jgi:ComF family protein